MSDEQPRNRPMEASSEREQVSKFKVGDILVGANRKYWGARHRIVYIEGTGSEPLGVMLTHTATEKIPCNLPLERDHVAHGLDDEPQFFVAHLLQKTREWGPYSVAGALTTSGISYVLSKIQHNGEMPSMTWEEYLRTSKAGCKLHPK